MKSAAKTTTTDPPERLGGIGGNDLSSSLSSSPCLDQSFPVWPRSLIVTQKRVPDDDSRVGPATTVTYYDYDRGGNLIQVFPDADDEDRGVLWDLELNTGRSYYFRPSRKICTPVNFPVGILRPDWLRGATPMGPSLSTWRRKYGKEDDVADRPVCGWTKLDFVDYYADASTGEPDSWYFHGMKANFFVLNYTATASSSTRANHSIVDPALFVPPDYCF